MSIFRTAFSLIELMVTLAIMGIVAAVAIPSYKDYVIKAKVAKTVAYLRGIEAEYFKARAAQNTIAPTFFFDDIYYYSDIYVTLNPIIPQHYLKLYHYSSTNPPRICVDTSVTMPTTENIRICISFSNTLSSTASWCGRWSNANGNVDIKYLPENCQCTNVGNTDEGSKGCPSSS